MCCVRNLSNSFSYRIYVANPMNLNIIIHFLFAAFDFPEDDVALQSKWMQLDFLKTICVS